MYKQKIGISVGNDYAMPIGEVLQLLKNIGFDAVSPEWETAEMLAECTAAAREIGLELQSLHAPFGRAAAMWNRDPAVSVPARDELLRCIDACAQLGIPILVVHTWIGFDYRFDAEALCFDCFDETVRYAKERDVQIAFENTEGEEYLFALMDRFAEEDAVGFCWDSGHEMCYNHSADLLARFGDRLIMTHLNDNLGISRYDGKTFWTDDLHLLPYDGVADWEYNVRRLKDARPLPILNFELNTHSKPNRHENDVYTEMTPVRYYTEAYKRACRIAYNYSR